MANPIEAARQPNSYIVGICLDCDNLASAGSKRFLTETGHCATCGSAATLIPNAVREMARRGVKHAKEMVEQHYDQKSRKGKRRR